MHPQTMTLLEESQKRWDIAAETYEKAFVETLTGTLWRSAVWSELDRVFPPGSTVLEMNCGTGVDARHLAKRGVAVCACDISAGMIERARDSAVAAGLDGLLEFRVLATENLDQISPDRRFSGAFSNFSGLNCVSDLGFVSKTLAARLISGSQVLLCMLGPSAKWEGFWRMIQRRFTSPEELETVSKTSTKFEVKRYSVDEVAAAFAPSFRLCGRKGIGIFVPPAFVDHLSSRFPITVGMLATVDALVSKLPFFRDHGGCVLLEFERTAE